MSAAEQSHKATTSSTAEEQNTSGSGSRLSGFKRFGSILENKNVQTGARFFSASAKTWIGMHPIWLMGEAVTGRVRAADGEASRRTRHVGLTTIPTFSESGYTVQKEWEGALECGGGVTRGNRDFHVRRFLWAAASDSLTNPPCDYYAGRISLF